MSRCWSAGISERSTNIIFKSRTVDVKSTARENLLPFEHRTCTVTLPPLASTPPSASSPIARDPFEKTAKSKKNLFPLPLLCSSSTPPLQTNLLFSMSVFLCLSRYQSAVCVFSETRAANKRRQRKQLPATKVCSLELSHIALSVVATRVCSRVLYVAFGTNHEPRTNEPATNEMPTNAERNANQRQTNYERTTNERWTNDIRFLTNEVHARRYFFTSRR